MIITLISYKLTTWIITFCHAPHRHQALPLHKLSITEKVVQAVQSMLLPQESLSIHTSLPATDGSAPVMAVVRLLAEIRTRWACSRDPLMCWGGAGQRDRRLPWASLCQVYWVHSMNFMPNWVTEAIHLCCVYYSFCCIPQLLCFEIKFSCFPKKINNQNMVLYGCMHWFALVKELCSIWEVFCHLALLK